MIGHSILRTAPRASVLVVVDGRTAVSRPSRTLIVQAPAGLPGPQGPPGPPGPPSPSVGGTYEHQQMVAAATWSITHNLGFRPQVSTFDTSADEIEGEVTHIDVNSLTVDFNTNVSGVAYLS